ncbi:ribosome maturation factor RimP [Eionea flava]
MSSVQDKLTALIEPVVTALGCELWGLEYLTQGRQATLRIYIEKSIEKKCSQEVSDSDDGATAKSSNEVAPSQSSQKDSGVGLHDCEKVSRQVSSVLDVEDPIASHYTLEVSSPGMDRPLFCLAHYERSVGEKVSIKLSRKFEERKNFSGIIAGVEDNDVVLRVDEEEYLLPVELIDKANIIPTFE